MMFEYTAKGGDRECVAFIDKDGDLIVKKNGDECVWFSKDGVVSDLGKWDDETAVHRFYPGDSITITF